MILAHETGQFKFLIGTLNINGWSLLGQCWPYSLPCLGTLRRVQQQSIQKGKNQRCICAILMEESFAKLAADISDDFANKVRSSMQRIIFEENNFASHELEVPSVRTYAAHSC
jgi:hypothetical protein